MAKQVWIKCPCCQEDHLLTPKRTVRGATTRKRRPSQSVKAKDEAWAQAVKQRDLNVCYRCGRRDDLQAAHIFTRSKRSTRWDLENGVCLCGGCHIFWAHRNPLEFYDWVKSWMGKERFEALQQRANQTQGRVKRAV